MSQARIFYRRDIDGLRSLAVLPVVFGHAEIRGFSGGFIGVDIFFVISGFLITSILVREIDEGRFSLIAFYERRARRILPALFAVLMTCLFVGWFALIPDAFVGLSKSVLATLSFLSNMWFWYRTGDYFGTEAEFEPLLHTWSLAVEEQFYIVFPVFLWLIARYGRRWLVTGTVVVSMMSFGASVWATSAMPSGNFYLAPTRAWELGLGAILAMGGFPKLRQQRLREAISGIGLLLILGSIALLGPSIPFPGATAIPAVFGTVLIIWSGAGSPTTVGRVLGLSGPVWVGLISYSLYLWHWPILVLLRIFHGSVHLPTATAMLAIAVSVFAAWLSWRYIERPFRDRRNSGISSRAVFSLSAIGAATLASVSLAIVFTDGAPARIDPRLLASYQEARLKSPEFQKCMNRTVAEGLCALGKRADDGRSPEVLIWGDSHAGAILDGLNDWMLENEMSGVAAFKAGCPPLWGIRRADMGQGHACDRFNAEVMSFAQEHTQIETVVLAARWALAFEGNRAAGEAGGEVVLALSESVDATIAGTDNAALAHFGLNETIRRLREAGKNILLIQGVPEIGFSVPSALLNAKFVGAPVPDLPDRADVDARNRRANDTIGDAAEKHFVALVNPADVLCRTECQITVDGHSLYKDDDHLSIFGSKWVLPTLAETGFEKISHQTDGVLRGSRLLDSPFGK